MYFERHSYENKELPIYFSEQLRHPAEPKYELHWHETGEWIWVQSGSVEIRIKDSFDCYEAGDLIFIAPHAPHCFRAMGGACAYYCMIPDNSILHAAGINPNALVTDALVESDEIKALFCRIIDEYNRKEKAFASIIKAKIMEMTALLIRHFQKNEVRNEILDDNTMRITKDAIAYMEDHYAEEFSGEALASYLGFSRSYLCHVISKVTGHSLTENLLYIRCRKARDLLRQGVSVSEAAFMSGFKNVSYFCRTYKRMMGETPSAHRRK